MAKAALRTKRATIDAPTEEQETILRAIAQVEGRVLGVVAGVKDELADVKEQRSPAQPVSRWHHVAPTLTAIAAGLAAVATVLNALRPPPVVGPEFAQRITAIEARLNEYEEKRVGDHAYELELRNDVVDILDKLGVKVVDPPGSPKHAPLEYLPAPKLNPNKIKAGETPHPIQPARPLPFPPPP